MAEKPKITDAEFEVVGGPFRVGDEHPTQKGWYFTDKIGKDGEALWHKPPGPISRWIRRGAWIIYALLIGGAILFTLIDGV